MVLHDKKPALTERQRDIYEFLKDKILNRGYGPTVREIGTHFGIRSPNGVMCHLKALEKKGLITRESHMSRAIQLAEPPQHRLSLPFAGRLIDGHKLSDTDTGERTDFADLFDNEGNCVLTVAGGYESINVLEGDQLIVNRAGEPVDGSIILMIDDFGNVYLCRHKADGFEYLGSSAPGLATPNRILGVVVAMSRRLE